MTFIAYNHQGQIVSIVVAKSKELAMAYWQGSNIGIPASSKCVEDENDFTPLSEHVTGVFPILKTITLDLSHERGAPKPFVIVLNR